MLKKFAVAAVLALGASSSFAANNVPTGPAPTLWYGGLDVGSSKVDDFDDRKTSVGGFVGYGFSQNVAVELGYRQLGKFTYSGIDVTAKQTHLSVIGSLPLNPQFSVYGRLGYNNVKVDVNVGGYSGSGDTNGVMYGVGAHYRFTPDILGRVEFQKPTSDSTNVHVGIVFEF